MAPCSSAGMRNHLRTTVEDAGVGTWEINLLTGAINCCATTARLFGVPCEALATYEDVLALLHPEDRQSTAKAIKRCIREHGVSEFDYRVIRPDGSMCWLGQRSRYIQTEIASRRTCAVLYWT